MWENPDHCWWWHPCACGPPWSLSVPAPTCMLSFPSTMNYITCKLKPFTLQSFSWSWCLSGQQESKQKLGQACVPCKNTVLLGHLFTVLVLFFVSQDTVASFTVASLLHRELAFLSSPGRPSFCLKFTVTLCLALNFPSNINRLLIHTQPSFSAFPTK